MTEADIFHFLLYVTIYTNRAELYEYLCSFSQVCKHHHFSTVPFPYHLPEILNRRWDWSFENDIHIMMHATKRLESPDIKTLYRAPVVQRQ